MSERPGALARLHTELLEARAKLVRDVDAILNKIEGMDHAIALTAVARSKAMEVVGE